MSSDIEKAMAKIGFKLAPQTGGGCSGYVKVADDGSYQILTEEYGCDAPEKMDERVIVWNYDADGDWDEKDGDAYDSLAKFIKAHRGAAVGG